MQQYLGLLKGILENDTERGMKMVKGKMDKKIKKIMKHFDFKKVHKVMKLLDWKWNIDDNLEVPSTKQIKENAKRLLEHAYENYRNNPKYTSLSTGGFEVRFDCGEIQLRFVLHEECEEL